ncbi:MAG: RNA polymerase sigma factor [Deltaproteobacteria bacterium]|jgi:RNA polymerase sigma-70 factor (ECF subfamily)
MLATVRPFPLIALEAPSPRRRPIDEASQALARRASSGDRRALEALLREHARAVGDVCRVIAGPEDGRDAAQEALEKIVVSIRSFDVDKGSFRAWALTVARNVCRDRLRRRGLERRLFEDPGEDGIVQLMSEAPDAERITYARIESRKLAVALESLPEAMRLAVVLFHVHEASYEEIAAALGVPMGTVMTWLHRGRKRLRAALEPAGTEGAA